MHLEERDRPAEELAHVEEERLVVRHQVLPPQRQREGVRLDDEEDHELRGEGADADEAAARAEELHERHRVLPERVRVLVADRPRRAAGGVARRRVGGEQRAEDDDDVRRVDRLGLERCSAHVIIVAIERHAKTIECRRNSGQMREPSLIRFVGMWKTSDVHESIRCTARHAGVSSEQSNRRFFVSR